MDPIQRILSLIAGSHFNNESQNEFQCSDRVIHFNLGLKEYRASDLYGAFYERFNFVLQSIVPSRRRFAVQLEQRPVEFWQFADAQNTLYIFLPSFCPCLGTALFAPEVREVLIYFIAFLTVRKNPPPTPTHIRMLQFLFSHHVCERLSTGSPYFLARYRRCGTARICVSDVNAAKRHRGRKGLVNGR